MLIAYFALTERLFMATSAVKNFYNLRLRFLANSLANNRARICNDRRLAIARIEEA